MIGIGAWGTAQMRTQGDDIAEVLSLLGVEPVWDPQSRRVQDLAVVPLERLAGRVSMSRSASAASFATRFRTSSTSWIVPSSSSSRSTNRRNRISRASTTSTN